MNEGLKNPRPHEQSEQLVESLSEEATIAFLESHGVKPLETWTPGTSVLCVLSKGARSATNTKYAFSFNRAPTLVRCENPSNVDFNPKNPGGLARIDYLSSSGEKRVDYYCIDGNTKQPVLVQTAKEINAKKQTYIVRNCDLFAVADDLFPPSTT